MPKRKRHHWKANPNIKGFFRCINCRCEKIYKRNGIDFDIIRGGLVDKTESRMTCFKLSKD
jgi:hypothetical protein